MKNFVLLGAAGYVAPRHMKAIRETGNRLVAAMDKHDAVGVIDSYFPEASFFVEFERLDRYVEKLRRAGEDKRAHYVSITSPNYLHDAHIRFALRVGADAICEKPLVLNPWNVDALKEIESETGKKVNTILQLRLHPSILALKDRVAGTGDNHRFDIDLTYITSRGKWYLVSWKGDLSKSGGVATNIGIHFFDMLQWVFGPVEQNVVHLATPTKSAGYLELKKARVRWYLSLDSNDLPEAAKKGSKTTHRSLTIDGEEIEFSEGFADLHTVSYEKILQGEGFGLDDSRPSVQIAYEIRNAQVATTPNDCHPLLR
jgi:UDP-N-acetyl-2-amino-2-deoxyglucuronate dehydrogenase